MIIGTTVWTQAWQTVAVVAGSLAVWLVVRSLIRRWARRVGKKLTSSGDLKDNARAQRLTTLGRTFSTIALIVVLGVAAVMVLAVWGVPIAPIVASLGVVGVAVGFGAQDFVKDLIAGLFVLVEDQYAVGDVIELAGVSGTVEEIRLRTTVLRDLDGSVYHIPNGEPRVAKNLTHDYSRLVVDLSIAYEESVDRVLGVISDEAEEFAGDPDWEDSIVQDPRVLGIDEFGESGMVVRVLLTTHPEERWTVKREFLRRVKIRFDRERIEIPYPHLTITRRDDPM